MATSALSGAPGPGVANRSGVGVPRAPAAPEGTDRFRSDESIDACFAVTPDMTALTGGPDATGSGDGTTVKGARVLVSTGT